MQTNAAATSLTMFGDLWNAEGTLTREHLSIPYAHRLPLQACPLVERGDGACNTNGIA